MYDLLAVYVQEPCVTPDEGMLAQARPYEFTEDKATRYSATSPHCGNMLDFGPHDTVLKFGYRFLRCQCTPKPSPLSIDDPFLNPVTVGILSVDEVQRPKVAVPAALKAASSSQLVASSNEDLDSLVDEIMGL